MLSMARFTLLISGLVGSVLLLYVALGCMDSGSNPGNEPLIRVRERVLTVLEFNKAFEITKAAYPHNFRHENEDIKKAKLRLLNQLAVEMIILERAEELGITISNEELDKAVADIKSDYPEDTFEETLLETAVSYESWEARLKNRLLMQKVIDSELKDQIVITPEDIARYYEKNIKPRNPGTESAIPKEDINEIIIKYLRREKAEEAYQVWIKKLKEKYSIEINSAQWEKISGNQYREGQDLEVSDSAQEAG